MEHEGMVDALRKIRGLLRPDGTLIDIHPVREVPVIEVRSDDDPVFSEPSRSFDYEDDLRHADEALAWAVDHAIFEAHESRVFEFVTYASSVAGLRDFFAVSGSYDDTPRDPEVDAQIDAVYARADEAMRASGERAEVLYRERARITRLTPAG
jgi:hypothetical protein